VGPAQVAQGQSVGRHVHADRLHADDAPAAGQLRAVEGGGGQGLVVGDRAVNALLSQQVLQGGDGVEIPRHRAARIAAQVMHAALGLQRALDEQFVAGEHVPPVGGQKSRINLHGRHCTKTKGEL